MHTYKQRKRENERERERNRDRDRQREREAHRGGRDRQQERRIRRSQVVSSRLSRLTGRSPAQIYHAGEGSSLRKKNQAIEISAAASIEALLRRSGPGLPDFVRRVASVHSLAAEFLGLGVWDPWSGAWLRLRPWGQGFRKPYKDELDANPRIYV